jgi:hypothetical protein
MARLDIADWLAHQQVERAEQQHPKPPGQDSSESPATVADADWQGEGVSYPSAVDQVTIFAEAMTTSIWKEIAAELGDTEQAQEIKRDLAQHGWCDLFIGLVRVIETCGKVLDKIPEWGKDIVKRAILDSSMQRGRSRLTSAVVDVVVAKVWSAFKGVLLVKVPLLSVLTSEDAARSLRILAMFACPAPERHQEVREHALKPIGDDAKKILTDQVKAHLAKQFDEWKAST